MTQTVGSQPKTRTQFYCCYLLQSISKRQSFYIGSTPDPPKRLRQHNGILSKGGAYRTRREGSRPWEMICIVYGFPNKISALQFEHAWQHGYQTHYIKAADRIVQNKNGGRTIHHKLVLIRQLINNVFFQYMNLQVHFFNDDTRRVWNLNKFKVDLLIDTMNVKVSDGALGIPKAVTVDDIMNHAEANQKLVKGFYDGYMSASCVTCEEYQERLTMGRIPCSICQTEFDYTSSEQEMKPLLAFCITSDCPFTSHLSCLHRYFLDDEQTVIGRRNLIPKSGKCPDCSVVLPWVSIVRNSITVKKLYGSD
ncbi:hypothetical protein NCAS_0H01370 [Naumovozyma castellii]|uniref:GIY-YIG domain-containing protein n=1 Tax=Naumovozyma castellii TaxID=27288 RepID=G0VIX0_NAUCA|nr:hypothetical protein NCAS_0H01370 [Naumovozyma castellii CBS 4309]CCC71447.1 hypothetical protein NCAS_0H01370 [Naumovozyma castellii CBS 4309]